MPCINPDGKPTASGRKMMLAMQSGVKTPDEIAREAGLPLFRVRSGLRDITAAGYAETKGEGYELTARGGELLK